LLQSPVSLSALRSPISPDSTKNLVSDLPVTSPLKPSSVNAR
jgi:hypothetical protein